MTVPSDVVVVGAGIVVRAAGNELHQHFVRIDAHRVVEVDRDVIIAAGQGREIGRRLGRDLIDIDADLAPLERTYLAADVSLGVGAAALGLLGYLWLTHQDEAAPAAALGARVTSRGATLSYQRAF